MDIAGSTWEEKVSPKHKKRAEEICTSVKDLPSSGAILECLLEGNTLDTMPEHAVPPGYHYTPCRKPATQTHDKGLTVAFHAHPSDNSGDFASYLIMHTNGYGAEFKQVLATHGEATKAKDRLPAGTDIAEIRRQEEAKASAILGIETEYLARKKDGYFPDGKLLEHLPELKDQMKEYISTNHPSRILLPSPWPDHADHLAVYIAGMNAIVDLQKEGYFQKYGKMEIIACEPEFGVALGQPKAVEKVRKAYGDLQASAYAGTALPYYPYSYSVNEAGAVSPASDITRKQEGELSDLTHYPMAVPPVIIAVTNGMLKQKMAALLQHETQTSDIVPQAHQKQAERMDYAFRIPALDRLRGMTVGKEWGVGVYPIHIPGVTGESTFLDAVEPGSVFELHKGPPAKAISHPHGSEKVGAVR